MATHRSHHAGKRQTRITHPDLKPEADQLTDQTRQQAYLPLVLFPPWG
jgi:hypothetical protein